MNYYSETKPSSEYLSDISKQQSYKILNAQGSLLKLLNPEVGDKKMNVSINPRQQRKREPLMNFLKPFQ